MKVKFITLGCKVNQYETNFLINKFLSRNCQITDNRADLYIVNTCSVTQSADRKSLEAILRAKRENPQAKIAVCGCLAQLDKEKLEKLNPDYIVPQDDKLSLDTILMQKSTEAPTSSFKSWFLGTRPFVKVQDGCDMFCSFCKIPHIRGRSRSRPPEEVLEEIAFLSCKHPEIVLAGVNLSLYGKDLNPCFSLEQLVEEILKIPSLGRLRLSSLEPYFLDDKLLSFLTHPKFCPHLHLSFQSGDDKVLAAMNKKETVSLYKTLLSKARKINSDLALSCDIMIGFPAEDEESFFNTANFLKEAAPMRTHIFTFSPRQPTPFGNYRIIKNNSLKQRYNYLKKITTQLAYNYYSKFIGRKLTLLAEEYWQNFTVGYTENYIKVYLKGRYPLGKFYSVSVEKIEDLRVYAKLI